MPGRARRTFRWLGGTITALVILAAAILVVSLLTSSDPGPKPTTGDTTRPTGHASPTSPRTVASSRLDPSYTRCPCPDLVRGSNPKALPTSVLIADHLNNRLLIVAPNGTVTWMFPRPGDLAPGQSFLVPDDAFFTPDGQDIVVTQEDDFVISLVNIARHRIVWRYGTPGVPGSGNNQLWNPDDAMMMPDGDIITADIKNCRILILRPGYSSPLHIYGITTNECMHAPPQHWGSPNGSFPMRNGHYLVTEINGDWVDELTLTGRTGFVTNPPGVSYPSDTNEVRPGLYLTTDYSNPGQIVEFDQSGRVVWRYQPAGAAAMDQPSLALPLPGGNVICNDDFNHRVIVVDPRTGRILWQYGHTGVPGSSQGYLNDPDGVDMLPPLSLTIANSSTMGNYPVPRGAPMVAGQLP